MKRILRREHDSTVSNDPYCVADVTIAIRFNLEHAGVHLQKMKTKSNIMGFYNPIPPFKKEYDTPVLCVVYMRNSEDVVHIDYFSDREEVKILVGAPD